MKLQEALKNQSTKDALTGLLNRRGLEESLDLELRRGARADQPVGVVMFDLDHFKVFNDSYGHEAGDSVLRELGAFVLRSIRAEDVACRFGGEEFVLILPGATAAGAQSRAERLRSKVRELTVLHQGKSMGVVTISAGVAAFPVYGLSVTEVLAAADSALYKAKKDGRDRVVVATPGRFESKAAAASQHRRVRHRHENFDYISLLDARLGTRVLSATALGRHVPTGPRLVARRGIASARRCPPARPCPYHVKDA